MQREALEAALRHTYAMREAGDVDRAMEIFAPHATYHIKGEQHSCAAAGSYCGADARTALEAMCQVFHAVEFRPTSILIEGTRAVACVRARFVFVPTGEDVETELVHVWTFADGKCVEISEFLDTAHVARLHASAQPAR